MTRTLAAKFLARLLEKAVSRNQFVRESRITWIDHAFRTLAGDKLVHRLVLTAGYVFAGSRAFDVAEKDQDAWAFVLRFPEDVKPLLAEIVLTQDPALEKKESAAKVKQLMILPRVRP